MERVIEQLDIIMIYPTSDNDGRFKDYLTNAWESWILEEKKNK